MINEYIPRIYFDELGEENFRSLLNELLPREFGKESFIPFPKKGRDGGIDAQKLSAGYDRLIFQYKFREVSRYQPSTLQGQIYNAFNLWVKDVTKKYPNNKDVFITNVPFTAQTHKLVEKVINEHGGPERIEYWEQERLLTVLHHSSNEDLKFKYLPRASERELRQIKEEIEKRKKELEILPRDQEIKNAKSKLQKLFVDSELKYKYYYPFIDLLEPFYFGERGLEQRKKLRSLFEISEKDELEFIRRMQSERHITVIGDVCIVENQERATTLQKEMIDRGGVDLDTIVKLFI